MFNKMEEDIEVIGGAHGLPDRPLEGAEAISVAELKSKFDYAGSRLKAFVNSLIETMAAGTAAGNIGAQYQGQNTTVQAALNALGEAVSVEYSGTLATDGWTGTEAPYTQAVTISGVLATDSPIIDLVPSNDYATAVAEDAAWGSIYRAVTSANTITFYAKEAPTVALTFKARCIRK